MMASLPRPAYGGMVRVACVKWRPRLRSRKLFAVSTGPTYAMAKLEALRRARARGYETPRWWQWWRWFERRYDEALMETEALTDEMEMMR